MPGFDDNGRPVQTVAFDYPEFDDAPAASTRDGQSSDLVEAISGAMAVVLTGHRDGIAIRAAALAHILNVPGFGTQREAARRLRVKPAAIFRAVAKLRCEFGMLAELRAARAHIAQSRARVANSETLRS